MSCCAFGNSLTLPLVFLLALLPAAAADRATGYLALFMMGWSPMLWSFGLQLLGRSMPLTQPGVLFFTCVRPAACAVILWLTTTWPRYMPPNQPGVLSSGCVRLRFGALACSHWAGPCQLLSLVRSPTVVLGCALELWPAAAWQVHATNSTRCALLLLC